jgi:hypothetical protein
MGVCGVRALPARSGPAGAGRPAAVVRTVAPISRPMTVMGALQWIITGSSRRWPKICDAERRCQTAIAPAMRPISIAAVLGPTPCSASSSDRSA